MLWYFFIKISSRNHLNINHYAYSDINACSLNKNFNDLQHLLSCTKTKFDLIAISEIRITRQVSLSNNLNLNNYSFEFTPTGTSAGGTLLYITNHLWYKCRNDVSYNLDLLLLKLSIQKNQILLRESFTGIYGPYWF